MTEDSPGPKLWLEFDGGLAVAGKILGWETQDKTIVLISLRRK